jgi:hypothetical protein
MKISILYIFTIGLIIYLANNGDLHVISFINTIPYSDKLGHFILMGLLAFSLNTSFKCHKFTVFGHQVLKGTIITFLFVNFEELTQIFIDNRNFDPKDLLFDYLGILFFSQLADYLHELNLIKSS